MFILLIIVPLLIPGKFGQPDLTELLLCWCISMMLLAASGRAKANDDGDAYEVTVSVMYDLDCTSKRCGEGRDNRQPAWMESLAFRLGPSLGRARFLNPSLTCLRHGVNDTRNAANCDSGDIADVCGIAKEEDPGCSHWQSTFSKAWRQAHLFRAPTIEYVVDPQVLTHQAVE